MHDLPGGGVLIAADEGLFVAPPLPLPKADVKLINLKGLVPSPEAVEIRLSFTHPCAPASANLGLTLVAAVNGTELAPKRMGHPADGTVPSATTSTLVAAIPFDRPGAWTLQVRQGPTPVGEPMRFNLAPPTLWAELASAWQIILAGLAGAYAVAFGALLLLAHRRARVFNVLSDAVWAKWLTWPFFLLRHVPAVQQWVLEPWFQEVRRTTRTDVPFIDPPVSSSAGPPSEGLVLVRHLRDTRRLWLHGRSGMGKSSLFAAWERAYFAAVDAPNLNAAVRRYGFILIMLPVRHYAALAAPEASRPESWVLEAVRRRLEQFGLATRDLGLIEAMLKAGRIALALDGANEADRDTALTDFARQFQQVRLLVTSQAMCDDNWEVWNLPQDIGALRDRLLVRWLGDVKGAQLSRRLDAQELSDFIVSGYDLRLVADLAAADPEHAPLPSDRIGLYLAILARAKGGDGQPLRLEGLKQVAWTMVTQRRREILPDDEKVLGSGTLKALLKEGLRIVRPVGAAHEFRHDQMRAFLAALWLVGEMPTLAALEKEVVDRGAFGLNRRDQEELWRFVVPLVASAKAASADDSSLEDLKALWRFANDEPEERAILLKVVQDEADDRGITLVRAARRRKSRTAPSTQPDA
jgi:hypothetical protein